MIKKLITYYHTIKYLKPIQIKYQLWYRFKKKLNFGFSTTTHTGEIINLSFVSPIYHNESYNDNNFTFLNQSKEFENSIDWNHNEFGKLWAYNLNYFDFLHQINISKEDGVLLIKDYIQNYKSIIDGKEAAPTAIRIINWIKFIIKHELVEQEINATLWQDANRLLNNIEYHLLGNHILEDAFGLLFASYYFHNEILYHKARYLLETQLEEQILKDGAHFELSPMYHQLMLYRTLDAINLLQNNKWQNNDLLYFISGKATKMTSWLETVAFRNGDLPRVNDAAKNVYPSFNELIDYFNYLKLTKTEIKLEECGYRKFVDDKFELFIDVGNIGPSYQPGHAHADTFNFILYSNNKPLIIDTGISTYNFNERRIFERSTSAHNTVTISEKNSSQVWSGFRVGKRANVFLLDDTENFITAWHDGYLDMKVIHERSFHHLKNEIIITDKLKGNFLNGKAHFHFDKDIAVVKVSDFEFNAGEHRIVFENAKEITFEHYQYAEEFNQLHTSIKLIATFNDKLTTKILS